MSTSSNSASLRLPRDLVRPLAHGLTVSARAARAANNDCNLQHGSPAIGSFTVWRPSRSGSFTRHPGADVWRAVAEHDPVTLAGAQETNGILIDADQILEVQDERPAKSFHVERRGALAEVVGRNKAAHGEHRIAVVCVLNFQHQPSPATTQTLGRPNALNLLELHPAACRTLANRREAGQQTHFSRFDTVRHRRRWTDR